MKKVLYSSTLVAALLLGACGNEDKAEDPKTSTEQTAKSEDQATSAKENKKVEAEIAKKNEGVVEKKADFKYDDKIKKAIEKEKNVSSSTLLITKVNDEDYIMTDINVDNDHKAAAKKLAKKYANTLHKKYPKHVVDVRVLSGDNVLAQETIK
ncbi:hypothetical protein [Kurthia massiliensis]|uniref:hypothetical protein n=1 Tax=Kurthia massiliensis TaxID=1033739 RepID=UPI000288296B|nr:hypothetical protein [Kurthia massiliensis]